MIANNSRSGSTAPSKVFPARYVVQKNACPVSGCLLAKATCYPSNRNAENEERSGWSKQDNQRPVKPIGSLSTFVVDDFEEFVGRNVGFSDLLLGFCGIPTF